MLIYSILILISVLYIIFIKKNIKLGSYVFFIGLFIYYLVGYNIKIDLILSELSLLEYIEFFSIVFATLALFYIFKFIDSTKIITDVHSLFVNIYPYNVQKMLFLFLIVQIFVIDYNYIFLSMIFFMIIARTLKISRMNTIITILLGYTTNLVTTNYDLLVSYSGYEVTDILYDKYFIFVLGLNALSVFVIILVDRLTYRSADDVENQNLSIWNYILLLFTMVITFTLSMIVLQLYFSIYTSFIFASIIAIIALTVISQVAFKKIDFLDFDDFFQRKDDNVLIIVSFLMMIFLFVSYIVAIKISITLGLILFTILYIVLKRIYKIERKNIDFDIEDVIYMMLIVGVFWLSNILISYSGFNNSSFEITISENIYNVLQGSSSWIIGGLEVISLFPFLGSAHISNIVMSVNTDILELYFTLICTLATSMSFFVLIFMLYFTRLKKHDYIETLISLLLYVGLFLVAAIMLLVI